MTSAEIPASGSGPIVERIAAARRTARRLWRLEFALVWLALVLGIVWVLAATGNVDLEFVQTWTPFILGGVGFTLLVCVSSIIGAVVLALLGALGRLSANPLINGLASFYVSLVRGTPLLVQIYFVYYGLPQVGVILDALPAGILALSFNYGAYMTEIFRAGIQAVPRGQQEAAEALGMPSRLVFRRVILPQAFRIVIPAIGNEFIAMIKDSSLVSIIGLQEILWRAGTAGRPILKTIPAFLIAALFYWVLTIIFSFFQERLERRLARSDVR